MRLSQLQPFQAAEAIEDPREPKGPSAKQAVKSIHSSSPQGSSTERSFQPIETLLRRIKQNKSQSNRSRRGVAISAYEWHKETEEEDSLGSKLDRVA